MKNLICIILCLSIVSCASTTIIKVDDPKAKLYIDGDYVGMGTAVYTDRNISWTTRTLKIEKEGCKSQFEGFSKDEKVDILPLVSGILLIVPLLWTMKYNAIRNYNVECTPI